MKGIAMDMDNIDRISQALNNGNRCFIIRGAAGTGKTTLVKSLIPLLRDQGFGIRLMAPTGRAALILDKRTGVTASTIHSGIFNIHDDPIKNEDGDALKWVFPLREDIDEENEAFIVDEASMIGLAEHQNDRELFQFGTGSLLKDLIKYSGVGTKGTTNILFFVGDSFQLPPVGERCEFPPALDVRKLEELTGIKPVVIELTDVHRQEHESGILEEATKIRKALSDGDFNRFSFAKHSDLIMVEANNIGKVFDFKEDGDDKIVIACTNMRVRQYNNEIRSSLGHFEQMPEYGERLLCVRNTQVHLKDGKKVQFFNGDFLRVLSVSNDLSETIQIKGYYRPKDSDKAFDYTYTFQKMSVEWVYEPERGEAAAIWVNITPILLDSWDDNDGYASIGLYNGIKDNIKRILRKKYADYLKDPAKKSYWDDKVRKMIHDSELLHAPIVKFGYAITGHKSQGGEWKDVLVDYSYGPNQQTSYFFRWAYTVTTRARRRLYAVCPPRIDSVVDVFNQRALPFTQVCLERDEDSWSDSIFNVIEKCGYKICEVSSLDEWSTRIEILKEKSALYSREYVDVVWRKNGIVSCVRPHVSNPDDSMVVLQSFVGKNKTAVFGRSDIVKEPLFDNLTMAHERVVERIINGIDGSSLHLVSAKALTPYQVRLMFSSKNGNGELDLFFKGKGTFSAIGRNTLSDVDFCILKNGMNEKE